MTISIGTIVTHTHPDMDAIAACWLLQRYGGYANANIGFVAKQATATNDEVMVAQAVVDVGGVWDDKHLRFDHNHLGAGSQHTCATLQVYEYLANKGAEVAHLRPLINLIFCADTGKKEHGAVTTYMSGIHAVLNGWKRRNDVELMERQERDTAILRKGYELLDCVDEALTTRYEAHEVMESRTTWISDDKVVRVLSEATPTMTHLAHEAGARMVVFASTQSDGARISYAMGIMRSDDHRHLNMGYLLNDALNRFGGELEEAAVRELRRWYAHPSGFMVGRGTKRNPNHTPSAVDPVALAKVVHRTHLLREGERERRRHGEGL